MIYYTGEVQNRRVTMTRHLYCCQNTAQEYLYHIVGVPDDFDVKESCLAGAGKQDFIAGLKALTAIVKNIYADMIVYPSEYGFPLIEDIEYRPFNPKVTGSSNAPNRLITILNILVQCGKLLNDGIVVDINVFAEMCKAQTKVYFKTTNSHFIFQKLIDFGFVIDGFDGKKFDKKKDTFTLSYPNDNRVVRALYYYMKDLPLNKGSVMSMHYIHAAAFENTSGDYYKLLFGEYLSGDERVFFKRLHEYTEILKITCVSENNFVLRYLFKPKDKLQFMSCCLRDGKLTVSLRLNKFKNIYSYTEYLDELPEHMKLVFHNAVQCRGLNCKYYSEDCQAHRDYILDERFYRMCSFAQTLDFTSFKPDEVEYFMRLISYEY